MTVRLVLRGGILAGGETADVAVDAEAGEIVAVGPGLVPLPGDRVEDCGGMVVLPAPADPHAHLDKALSADTPGCENPAGDLAGAIAVWHAHWPRLHHDDLVARATRAVEAMVLRGTTAIRTHVDIGPALGLRALEALREVKADVEGRGLADLQLVGLFARPMTGDGSPAVRRLVAEAVEVGLDVVGGGPYLDPNPVEATEWLLEVAADAGLPVDLHTDETLDAEILTVADLARLVAERGPGAGVTASHCVSLGMVPPQRQEEVAAALAAAGVNVVTLPQTNLYLQARGIRHAPPRGLTPVRTLLDAGVNVAGGADNVRDPFCAMGRFDAAETAALLVMAGHLTPAEAWEACSARARRALGVPGGRVAVGEAAELLCIEGTSLAGAIAGGGERRLVVHRGAVVARTEVRRVLGGGARSDAPLEPAGDAGVAV